MTGGGGARGRPEWGAVKSALAAAGFRPSRRLGQNFLLDDACARAIVRDAGVGEGDFVLEVGPGWGALTAHLLAAGCEVLAVEVDLRLLELARRFLPAGRVEWVHADVLRSKRELAPEVEARLPAGAPWHLVSNLPYAVAGPLLAQLAARDRPPSSGTALVQLEVAERLAARPGDPAWGALGAVVQASLGVRLGRRLAPELFWPRPKVESALVHLAPLPERRPAADRARLAALVAVLFQHRRQSLLRVLARALDDRPLARELLARQGLDPSSRGERLAMSELFGLADSPEWRRAFERA